MDTIGLSQRKKMVSNPVAQRIYQLMQEKQSNLILSLDVTDSRTFFSLLDDIAPYIVALKTHCDIIEDFSVAWIKKIKEYQERYSFVIIEDRKFADIGNTSKTQYQRGIFKILTWADLVTVHVFPGEGIVQGLREAWLESRLSRGAILLPHMTTRDNLFTEEIEEKAIQFAKEYADYVVGFIGASVVQKTAPPHSAKKEKNTMLAQLRRKTWPDFLIFTPGIQRGSSGDELGQTFTSPQEAIEEGADCIIVGRGIITAQNPKEEAVRYKEEAWNAFLDR